MTTGRPWHPTIAVDFDDVLYHGAWKGPLDFSGQPIPGALDWLRGLLEDGWLVWLWTARLTSGARLPMWRGGVEEVDLYTRSRLLREWFWKHGAHDIEGHREFALWIHGGKPHANVYVDDKAMRLRPRTTEPASALTWPDRAVLLDLVANQSMFASTHLGGSP